MTSHKVLSFSITDTIRMPNTARVLKFPARAERPQLSAGEASSLAQKYLETPKELRSRELLLACLREPDAILAACGRLKETCDPTPAVAAEEAADLYSSIVQAGRPVGFFDERHYFLGELALVAGRASRLLGNRDEAELWLDRSEAAFRHIVNPGPMLANVSYERLAIQYEMGRYDRVLELVPSLIESFDRMGMSTEALNCRLLRVMNLKAAAQFDEARAELQDLRQDAMTLGDVGLRGLVLVNLAEFSARDEKFTDAVALCGEALPLLKASNKPYMIAHMKGVLGECLRQRGDLAAAVGAYREAIQDYATLGMATWVAYLRVVVSETLIALDRSREAEWEILAALPTIEEQKMVPEGFAAVALLKESVRRRKADPNALRELREHLQANK
jgi:tetratricopeptide (TPR) repeat protein